VISRLLILTCFTLIQPAQAHDPDSHHHHAAHDSSTFTIHQRTSRSLDVVSGHLTLSLGDITAGQVRTRIHNGHGHTLSGFPRPMRSGDHWSFFDHGHQYQLILLSLRNELVGNDSAVFRIETDPHHHQHGLTEHEKIEALIKAVVDLDGLVFLRNEDAYPPDKAARHLQRKWAWKGSQISTVDDFIKVAATRSSETGERYQIHLSNGEIVDSAQWFKTQLNTILHSEMDHTHDE